MLFSSSLFGVDGVNPLGHPFGFIPTNKLKCRMLLRILFHSSVYSGRRSKGRLVVNHFKYNHPHIILRWLPLGVQSLVIVMNVSDSMCMFNLFAVICDSFELYIGNINLSTNYNLTRLDAFFRITCGKVMAAPPGNLTRQTEL